RLRRHDRGPQRLHAPLEDEHAAVPPAGEEHPPARLRVPRVPGAVAVDRRTRQDQEVTGGSVRNRLFAVFSGISVATALGVAQTPAPAAKPAAKPYVVPKTPWGDPDLQGTYKNV